MTVVFMQVPFWAAGSGPYCLPTLLVLKHAPPGGANQNIAFFEYIRPVRFGVISDTHLPGRARALPGRALELFSGVEAIFHAGDFVQASVLEELKEVAPTHGVLGNCDSYDLAGLVPLEARIEVAGLKIGMIHDSGQAAGRRQRMAGRFPGHRIVIFGHSHQPVIEDDGELMLLNPGSACDPRRAKIPSVAILEIDRGAPSAELIFI